MISAALLILAMTPGVDDTIFQSGYDDPDACPFGRQVLADIDYGTCIVDDVDVTQWSNIWGYDCLTGGTVPFPGSPGGTGDATILDFGRTTYIAAHFHVPADLPTNTYGWITHTEYNYGLDLTASISTACGDFAPANPECLSVAISGQNLVPWRVGAANFCPLTPGTDYFLNIKPTNAMQGTSTCEPGTTSCAVGLANVTDLP